MSWGNSYKPSQHGLILLDKADAVDEPQVDIVLISAPGLTLAKDWAIRHLIAQGSQGTSLGNVNIYAYEAWSAVDDNFTWTTLSNHGQTLVDILATRNIQDYNSSTRNTLNPVVLVAHSLAGFVLKKCLTLVHKQKDKYRPLKDAISGAILMGSPHSSISEPKQALSKRCSVILQLLLGDLSRKVITRLEKDVELSSICEQFDSTGANFRVVTLYEQHDTRIDNRWRPLSRSPSKLVDAEHARMKCSKFETVIGIDTDHRGLPSLRDVNAPFEMNEVAIRAIQRLMDGAHQLARHMPDITKLTLQEASALEPLIDRFEARRPPPELPRFMVDISRQRNSRFIGRHDILAKLENILQEGCQTALLHGMGGLGKSEVALEIVHRLRDDFDAVFWIQADDLSKLRHDFGRFAAELGLGSKDLDHATDAFTSREIVKDWLINPIKAGIGGKSTVAAKWLIVFDSVDTFGTLKEFRAIFGKGSILMTSTDPEIMDKALAFESQPQNSGIPFTSVPLPVFSKSEAKSALKLLASAVDNMDEDEAATAIVRSLDGWPLAINHMAGIIRNGCLTLQEFHEQYKDAGLRYDPHTRRDETQETMVASLRMAKLSAGATALLRVCAMLEPYCIQELLFSQECKSTTFLPDFPRTFEDLQAAKAELIRVSLVQRNTEKHQLWMHRVVQDTVRGECDAGTLDRAFRTAALLVKKAYRPPDESARDNRLNWEPCAVFMRHVVHLQQLYLRGAEGTFQPSFDFAWLLHEVGFYQRNLGNTTGTMGIERTLLLAESVCKNLPKDESEEKTFDLLSEIYHGLGAWANETNHPYECMKYNTLYKNMRLDALGRGVKPNERTAAAWNQYGTGLLMLRRYKEAMAAFEESIRIYKEITIPTPCPDSLPTVNLAIAYWLVREYEKADELLERGRLAREVAFGVMEKISFRTGRFYHAIGNVRESQNRLEESEIWHTRALDQYTDSLGPRHHRTADTRHKVAAHCLRKGDDANIIKAGQLIDQALVSWKLDPTSFGPEIARTTWLQGRQRAKAGNPTVAKQLLEEAADMRRKLYPADSRAVDQLEDEDFDDIVTFWSR
ncbi:hypothetical protein DOTSEDRAFT_54878 [Dothistroma septosporum NZE10]|uniref:Uncharacterized protein n=1 Tax=Dothistroma septosporum (strain NZE10 / CBS 128990) TaxID=675120 RepID=N1PIX1_DOTSN|nr:hypothetical protein DOTSEDRAFT_54878 [Dothistroma septosporum NZE10]